MRRTRCSRAFEHFPTLLVREHDRFPSGAKDSDPSNRSLRIMFDVVFKLLEVHASVGIKRRRDRGKDAVKEHGLALAYQFRRTERGDDLALVATVHAKVSFIHRYYQVSR